MSEYLMDANHLSPLVTVGHPLRERVMLQRQTGDQFTIVTLVLHEFLFGIASIPRAKQNQLEWENIKAGFKFLQVDELDAEQSAQLRLSLRQKGRQLDFADSFIATVALRYNLTLLSKDKDFLSVPNLKLENWLSA